MSQRKSFDRRKWLRWGSTAFLGTGLSVGMQWLGPMAAEDTRSVSKRVVRKRDLYPDEFKMMVALGESTTAGGWSTSRQRCWVSVLGGLINAFQSHEIKVVNSGIGANVISTRSPSYPHSGKPAANERLEKHVITHHPDLLIVSYGLNDARG